ncbi:MAG: phosphoserine phosphatase RsbU/P [Verrucomicrobiota bacterium]|jgi:sigma-B regulation protein RsbU (phosphoserine phosphatase)
MAIKRFNRPILSNGEIQQITATNESRAPLHDTGSIRVLMIEDDIDFATIIGQLLGQLEVEFQIESVGKLGEGISSLVEGDVDVVLLDLSLPDCKGLETLSAVRACVPHLPIVVLTGADDEELAIEALHRGAQDYLVKTEINGRILSRGIRYAVERNALRAELRHYTAQLEERNRAIEAELKLGRSIQEAYLPAARVTFPSNSNASAESLRFTCRFQPAANLSGDLFDVFELSETQVGVLICDVMGHGVSAALVSATLHGLVEQLRRFATDPAQFLEELNRGLHAAVRKADGPIFATAFYMVMDIAAGEMCYASAGHPAPVLASPVKKSVGSLQGTQGPALGLVDKASYTSTRRTMAAGDFLVLFTDGLYEIDGPLHEPYGQERLPNAIRNRMKMSPPILFDELLGSIRDFSVNHEFEDDVCLVGMEVLRVGSGVSV